MLTRIELKNFMSHAHTVIEPAEGLTVLIGPNNVGKSAIVAALQILCYNDNSTYVLRHGEKNCSVTVHTNDGHVIEWRRKNAASYVIDGQKFDRLGRDIPEELHRVLRLPKVDDDSKDGFDVHFGSQKSPIFLLDKSGTSAARFFASSSDAIRLVQMQQRHKEKIREAKSEKNRLEKRSVQVNRELEALQPIVAIEPSIKQLEELHEAIGRNETGRHKLKSDEREISSQSQVAAFHQAEHDCLIALDPPPEMDDEPALDRAIKDLLHESGQHDFAAAQLQALDSLAPVPPIEDVEALSKLIEDKASAQNRGVYFESLGGPLAWLDLPPTLPDAAPLANLIDDLSDANAAVSANTALMAQLKMLMDPPELSDEAGLRLILKELRQSAKYAARFEQELELISEVTSPDLDETESLSQFLPLLEQAVSEVHRYEKTAEITASLMEQPDQPATEPLDDLLENMSAELKAIAGLERDLANRTAELRQLIAELRRAAEQEVCPTCGGPIDVDRLLQRTALMGEDA